MNQGDSRWRAASIVCNTVALILFLALPVTGSTAQTLPVLGYVDNEKDNPERLAAFRQGLSELGYLEGKNIIITFRHAKLDRDYSSLVTELVGLKVNIILAGNAPAAVAASNATRTISIVMGAVNDPVRLGLINSLEHPGTNVTGTTMFAPQLIDERLQIIRSIVPAIDKVAMLINGNNANNSSQFELLKSAAEAVGIQAQALDVRTPSDIEPAIAKAMESGAKVLFNCVDNFINSQRFTIAKLAATNKLPVIYTDFEYVVAGGLMSLGPGHLEGFHGAAKYVDMILRGADPADLPIARPTQFTFSVSRGALNYLGLTLPSDISAQVNDWRP
jgi:putative ABC transport system substrate-binding protein